MTLQDFIQNVSAYYGGFANETIAKLVINDVKDLEDKGREKLFRTLIETVNARYKPDVKDILNCMSICGATKKRFCSKCGEVISTGTCFNCEKTEALEDMATPEQLQEFSNMISNLKSGFKVI